MECPSCGANKKGELSVGKSFGEKDGEGGVDWKSEVECICGREFIYPDECAEHQSDNTCEEKNNKTKDGEIENMQTENKYSQDSLF